MDGNKRNSQPNKKGANVKGKAECCAIQPRSCRPKQPGGAPFTEIWLMRWGVRGAQPKLFQLPVSEGVVGCSLGCKIPMNAKFCARLPDGWDTAYPAKVMDCMVVDGCQQKFVLLRRKDVRFQPAPHDT